MNLGPDNDTSLRLAEAASDPELEAALRHALTPVLPPAGFSQRLMERFDAETAAQQPAPPARPATPSPAQKGRLLTWPHARGWVSGAIAAALVVGVVEGGVALQHLRSVQQQQRRVREATQQFQTSERITLKALAQAREQLQRAGVPLSSLD